MRKQLDKVYDPAQVEDRTYQYWEEGGFFGAQPDENKTPYTIVIPPPNITGQLHMGHALDETLQDILIRFRRMQGFAALWGPGTDHASIATEAKIVEAMRKEGLSKEDLGRDGFLERAWNWKKQYGGRIVEQLKKLGSSCDLFPEIRLQIVVLIAVYEITLGKAIVVHTSESVGLGQGVEYVLICDGSNDQILYMVASALAGCLGLGFCGCLCCKYALSRQHSQAHSQTQQQTYGLLFHLFPP